MADEPIPAGAGGSQYTCVDCGHPSKTAQGLAGHRRLAHSAGTRSQLEAKEGELAQREAASKRQEAEVARRAADARRRETEVERRRKEIEETGPSSIGMVRCDECGSWFENAGNLHRHERAIHPIEDKVATEVGRPRARVDAVWIEACHKQNRHPKETPEQIVRRFVLPTDQKILRALLARNAAFHFAEE
jgi:hypothetical protein